MKLRLRRGLRQGRGKEMLRQVEDGVTKPRAGVLPAPFLWELRSPNIMAGGVFKSPGEPARRGGRGGVVKEQEVLEEGSGPEG